MTPLPYHSLSVPHSEGDPFLPLPPYTFFRFSGGHFGGQFVFFAALGDANLREHFQKHGGGDPSASYAPGTVRAVVFVIRKLRKFSVKKCTPVARRPGHKQASETQPALLFLKRPLSKCGLLKDMSERERGQGRRVPKGKKNTNCSDSHPQGSLKKTTKTLPRKGYLYRK